MTNKIKPLEKAQAKAKKLKHDFALHDELCRLHKKRNEIYKVWKYGKYVIVKCGSELQFASVDDKTPKKFNFDLGKQVWVQNVYLTGVEGLL